MASASLGIHHQHSPSRVAFLLGREKSNGKLPLAGAPSGIHFRIIGDQRLRSRQALLYRSRDAREIRNFCGVKPDSQACRSERVRCLARTFAIRPGVAEENIKFGVHQESLPQTF
jgi:hypothetical protein